jgi:hypothetical protein
MHLYVYVYVCMYIYVYSHQASSLKKRLMEWVSGHAHIMSHPKWSALIASRPSLAAECCRAIGHASSPSSPRNSKKRNRRND